MLFNYELPLFEQGAMMFPNWPFLTQPIEPSAIRETIQIKGTNIDVNVGLGGTVDD